MKAKTQHLRKYNNEWNTYDSATEILTTWFRKGRQRGLVLQKRGYESIVHCLPHDGSNFTNFIACVTDMTSPVLRIFLKIDHHLHQSLIAIKIFLFYQPSNNSVIAGCVSFLFLYAVEYNSQCPFGIPFGKFLCSFPSFPRYCNWVALGTRSRHSCFQHKVTQVSVEFQVRSSSVFRLLMRLLNLHRTVYSCMYCTIYPDKQDKGQYK